MFDAKSLLDQLVGSGVAGGFSGGLDGGALANALSGKKAKKVAGSALQLGGMALVGGLTYKAWQNYQQDPAAGAATTAAWINEPDLRTRVGKKWSRPHYQIHQAHRGNRFVHDKIAILKQLARAGGHTHLVLAGDPDITRRIRNALPNELADKLVDVIPACERDQQAGVVMAMPSSFIEHEEMEYRSVAERLLEGLRSQNLAVAGTEDTLDALRWGEVDTLVMASIYQPDPGWTCTACRAIGTETPEISVCPECGKPSTRPTDIREALLRLAGQSECPVEVVEQSDALMNLGGVGCLLRYQADLRKEKAGGFTQVLSMEKA